MEKNTASISYIVQTLLNILMHAESPGIFSNVIQFIQQGIENSETRYLEEYFHLLGHIILFAPPETEGLDSLCNIAMTAANLDLLNSFEGFCYFFKLFSWKNPMMMSEEFINQTLEIIIRLTTTEDDIWSEIGKIAVAFLVFLNQHLPNVSAAFIAIVQEHIEDIQASDVWEIYSALFQYDVDLALQLGCLQPFIENFENVDPFFYSFPFDPSEWLQAAVVIGTAGVEKRIQLEEDVRRKLGMIIDTQLKELDDQSPDQFTSYVFSLEEINHMLHLPEMMEFFFLQ